MNYTTSCWPLAAGPCRVLQAGCLPAAWHNVVGASHRTSPGPQVEELRGSRTQGGFGDLGDSRRFICIVGGTRLSHCHLLPGAHGV